MTRHPPVGLRLLLLLLLLWGCPGCREAEPKPASGPGQTGPAAEAEGPATVPKAAPPADFLGAGPERVVAPENPGVVDDLPPAHFAVPGTGSTKKGLRTMIGRMSAGLEADALIEAELNQASGPEAVPHE